MGLLLTFQFQHGAIGSASCVELQLHFKLVSIPAWCDWEKQAYVIAKAACESFNSSMVRLGDKGNKAVNNGIYGFNSSMVRLGDGSGLGGWLNNVFQFQHGAIGRPLILQCKTLLSLSFNSSMVRLGASIRG